MNNIIDKSPCKWSEQVDGYCPYQKMLNKYLKSVGDTPITCKKEKCLKIAKEKTGKDDEVDIINVFGETDLLKSEKPANSQGLLDQNNIRETLKDFAISSVKNDLFVNIPFYAINFEMADFMDSYSSELRDLDYEELYNKGFRYIGCVLNTDVWSGTGKHWVCIFGTLSKLSNSSRLVIYLEYFNSSSNPYTMIKSIPPWIDKLKKNYDVKIKNIINTPLQESETECGIWCLYYIKSRLLGYEANYFIKNNINDMDMIKSRKFLFTY